MISLEIITVVKNDIVGLYKTYDSLIKYCHNQKISWLIIDGSDDFDKYNFDKIKFRVVRQYDTGIYKAMNLGIQKSVGDYCIFLNAGDVFIKTLKIDEIFKNYDVDVFCYYYIQSFCMFNRNKKAIIYKKKFRNLLAMPTSHQAMIFKGRKLREKKFDESFRICGDYAFYLSSLNNNWKYRVIDEYLIAFKMDGVSSTKPFLLFKESCIAVFKYIKANYFLKIFVSIVILIRVYLRYGLICFNFKR